MSLRDAVLQRDQHCCQYVDADGHQCGLDCRMVERAYYEALSLEMEVHRGVLRNGVVAIFTEANRHIAELGNIRVRLGRLGFHPRKAFYEVDHIQPLDEGGEHTIVNLRTLCPRHHAQVTREQAARRARRPRKSLPLTKLDRRGRVVARG